MTNLDKLAEIFPEVITETEDSEGKLISAIDFEHLKQILSDELLEGREAYVFNFVGKKRAEFEAHKPIKKTLRPIISDSRAFNTTKNLYIECDNLDALKILSESYLGKVKMIYIDPPYNTGNDFIYLDDFKRDADAFDAAAQVLDDAGNRILNRESRGRFHSDWCSMIYARLLLAKNFLSPDGVIFISIDDHEQANLKKICDEVFGEKNFVAQFVCKSKQGNVGTAEIISHEQDYIICYAKSIEQLKFKMKVTYHDERRENLRQWGQADRREDRPTMFYPIKIDGHEIFPIKPDGTEGRWRVSENVARKLLSENKLELVNKNGVFNVYRKFPPGKTEVPYGSWLQDIGITAKGTLALKNLGIPFSYPKPVELIKFLAEISTNAAENEIVLDFFSGSATTAQAVMELNAEDGGNRRFIMIQLPETTPENSEARRAGFQNICDIGKERIRRAGDKIKAKNPAVDTGFRVFRVDSSNFKPIPKVWTPQTILDFAENIKADRDEWDLLFGTLLETGKPIDLAVEVEEIVGVKILTCAGGEILASFDKNIPAEVFRALARRKPQKIFFRDASFASSADKINALEFFRNFAPDTTVKVL